MATKTVDRARLLEVQKQKVDSTLATVDVDDIVKENARAAKAEEGNELVQGARDAVDECLQNEEGDLICHWCAYTAPYKDGTAMRKAMMLHMRDSHVSSLIAFSQNPSLGVDARATLLEIKKLEEAELALPGNMGLDVLDELDEWNLLSLPKEITEPIERTGGSWRFCTAKNIDRFRHRGFEIIRRPPDVEMFNQHNHEDDTVRTGELIAMHVPEKIHIKRQKLRKALVKSQSGELTNRQEDSDRNMDAEGEMLFNHLIKERNMPPHNAMVVVNNIQKKQSERGGVPELPRDFEGTHTQIKRGGVPL